METTRNYFCVPWCYLRWNAVAFWTLWTPLCNCLLNIRITVVKSPNQKYTLDCMETEFCRQNQWFVDYLADINQFLLFRSVRKAAGSAKSSFSGRMGWSWSMTFATAAALMRFGSSCSSSGAAGSRRPARSSLWQTSETCSITVGSPARRAGCWLWHRAAASSKCRRQRRTTASCWYSTGWWTWWGRLERSGRAQPASGASSGACLQCSGRNELNESDSHFTESKNIRPTAETFWDNLRTRRTKESWRRCFFVV